MNVAPAALAALIVALLLVAVPYGSQDARHGLLSDAPDGAASLRDDLPDLVVSHGHIQPATDSVAVVGPGVAFTDAEVQALRDFVAGGGRLLVADDHGSGRGLLARMDVGIDLTGTPVTTPVYEDDPDAPTAFSTGVLPFPSHISLHRPVAVLGAGTPVLESSDLAWLDEDSDGRPDLDEVQDRYAFGRLRSFGDGEILVIGSARVLENAGHPLREGLIDWLSEDGRSVTYDDGHRGRVDPVGMARVLSGEAAWPWLLLPAALAIVAFRTFQVRVERVRPRRRAVGDVPLLEELEP